MESSGDFFKRAKAHSLKPTIVNDKSNFVVVTYWWGRGNINKNTQSPCPETLEEIVEWEGIRKYLLKDLKETNPDATESDVDPKDVLAEVKNVLPDYGISWIEPIKYEQMINNWETSCAKQKCNYLAEEYPEFAVKGGYQHAINFKPVFIELALKACYPRGVLYIDGDMKIEKYPSICDMKEVDYMARGWNTDPRPKWKKPACFDPYLLETSGGTMFFGNTYHAYELLKQWIAKTLKNPGKADDRIISQVITVEKMLTNLSTLQLPIEYLWLSLDFDGPLKDIPGYSSKKNLVITHPECLTGEDRATSEGASSSRQPPGYDRYVSEMIECRKNEIIYEYIHFETKSQSGPFRTYFDWLKDKKIVKIVPYSQKYGNHNDTAKENGSIINASSILVHTKLVVISENELDTVSLHKVSSAREIIPTILMYLLNRQHVVYVPKSTRSIRAVLGKANEQNLDFVTKNVSKSYAKTKLDYTLAFENDYPVYFGPNNKVLRHLLLMSATLQDFEKVFNESYLFLTRIHCGWV
jgi:hypothetical protein